MVGIFGVIVLGILALAGCGLIMMLSIAIPVFLVNHFRNKTQSDEPSAGTTAIIIGIMVLVIGFGIELFKIFIPAVIEMLDANWWVGMISAILMSIVISAPLISLFTNRIYKRIEDLEERISQADKRLDFDESHRLMEELKTAEIQYERRKNITIDVLIIVCLIGFVIMYLLN